MAERIIEQWHLTVLRVRLDAAARVPTVTSELVGYVGGSPQRLWASRHPVSAFGLADVAGPPHHLRVPDDLCNAVAYTAGTEVLGLRSSLWIRLVPPYGYLGAIPWEKALMAVADVPVFRVPDRLPVASDPGRRWCVAIAVDAQPDSTWAADYVDDLVRQLMDHVGPDLEVDVFADAGTVGRLHSPHWQQQARLHLHEPELARQASQVRVRRLMSSSTMPGTPTPIDVTSPGRIWADWIATGLGGRAVRALHIVLDAVWDAGTPLLAVSLDPSKPADTSKCTFVTGDDVRRLADNVGAATLSFGSPPDRDSGAAMRVIADAIGQQRPGTTIHSDIRDDPHGAALARMHGFIRGTPGPVPRDRSLFAYVQPERVQSALVEAWPQPLPVSGEVGPSLGWDDPLPVGSLPSGYEPPIADDVSSVYAGAETVPTWVAAAERYVGQQLADLARATVGQGRIGYKAAYERGAAEALTELQAIVAKYARNP